MNNFKNKMRDKQIEWRKNYLPNIIGMVKQNGKEYDHIIPWPQREHNFFPEIVNQLFSYLKANNIRAHSGIHNLLSSWVLCANLYWPFNNEEVLIY